MKGVEVPDETAGALRILGWAKTTLLDYPGKVASTLFLEGCNFRCPYCHNPELVFFRGENEKEPFKLDDILSYLHTYSHMIEGVCITGGEPLMQPGTVELCRKLMRLGLKIKLDTNGSLPDKLEHLLEEDLLDYVAVDVKGPPRKIQTISGTKIPGTKLVSALESTVERLRKAGIPHELRTTVVPGLLEPDDLHALGVWMRGASRFVLQQFRPGKTLDPLFQDLSPHPPQYLRELASSLSVYFAECTVRGIGHDAG